MKKNKYLNLILVVTTLAMSVPLASMAQSNGQSSFSPFAIFNQVIQPKASTWTVGSSTTPWYWGFFNHLTLPNEGSGCAQFSATGTLVSTGTNCSSGTATSSILNLFSGTSPITYSTTSSSGTFSLGIVPVANGGTGTSTSQPAGQILFGTGGSNAFNSINTLFFSTSTFRFRVNATTSESIGGLIGSGASTQKGLVVRGTTDVGSSASPDTISNLLTWWKADALSLSNNDAVSSWTDSSGNSNTMTQSTGGNQPIYKTNIVNGKPVVRFDATDDYLTDSLVTNSTGYTVFIVYSANAGGVPRRAIQNNQNQLLGPYNGAHQLYNNGFISAGAITAGQFIVSSGRFTTTGTQFFKNSSLVGSNGSAAANTNTWTLGTASEPLNGDIAEAIIFSRSLSGYEMDSVERYLGAKYNITLTSSHTQLENLFEVQSSGGTVLGSFTKDGNLGIATAQNSAFPIQVRSTDAGTTFSSPSVSGIHITGATTNGGSSPASLESMISLARTGVGGQAYANTAYMGLRRAFVSSLDPNTAWDFYLNQSGFGNTRGLSLFAKATSMSAYLGGYLNILGATDYSPLAGIELNLAASSDKGMIIKGASSQSADFLQLQNSSASSLFNVNSNGWLGIGTTTPIAKLSITGTSGSSTPLMSVATSTNATLFRINPDGTIGIGTTTPAGKLSVTATAGNSLGLLFNLASSSESSVFTVNGAGHIMTGGGTPAVSSCGTNPSISGNDTSGTVTVGTGVVTSCTITFANARANTPRVVGVVTGGGLNIIGGYSAKSTTAVTFSFATTIAGGTFDYLIIE